MPTFRERIEWLGRMPRHWKLLFVSQAIFLTFAISYRSRTIKELLEEEEYEKEAERRAKLLRDMRDNHSS